IGRRLTGSALTDGEAVPEGHYAEETMRLTVVPNRNAIMLTIAFGVAMARRAEAGAAAVHGGDHFIYPDCRPPFIDALAPIKRFAFSASHVIGASQSSLQPAARPRLRGRGRLAVADPRCRGDDRVWTLSGHS